MRPFLPIFAAPFRKAPALAAVLLLCPWPAPAFEGSIHVKLTRDAFVVLVDPGTNAILAQISLIGDQQATFYNSAAHYDNCAWNEGRKWIQDHRASAVKAAYDSYKSNGQQQQAVFDHLGYVLHATEDFYSHSNWIEHNDWGVIADFDGPKPAYWISDVFIQSPLQLCPSGSPTHDQMAKDSPDKPGHDEARADAMLAIQDQLAKFQAAVAAKYPAEASAILANLGIHAQPSVVDDALAWPNGRVYFFAGSQYYYYDMQADRVADDYPRAIVPPWSGLNPFASGIDASFAANNQKGYFFKGDCFISYDVAADMADSGTIKIVPKWAWPWSSGIDAVLPWSNGAFYIFKGSKYIKYDLASNKSFPNYPRKIAGPWPGLEPFSGGIDAAFLWPAAGKAYFFKGGYYIRYDVQLDRADPGYPLSIKDYWHGL